MDTESKLDMKIKQQPCEITEELYLNYREFNDSDSIFCYLQFSLTHYYSVEPVKRS